MSKLSDMAWIRREYSVPAKRGMRVRYLGAGRPVLGTITSAEGAHLRVRVDGDKFSLRFHPTWKIEYLPDGAAGSQHV